MAANLADWLKSKTTSLCSRPLFPTGRFEVLWVIQGQSNLKRKRTSFVEKLA